LSPLVKSNKSSFPKNGDFRLDLAVSLPITHNNNNI